MSEPAYIRALKDGTLKEKVERAAAMLAPCHVCPRTCMVGRPEGERGFCGLAGKAEVSSASPHFGEEACLVGFNGSGTIFFTGCNLKCIFCQNYEISHMMEGEEVGTPALGQVMLGLQDMGCHNINFVTPSHVVPQILAGVHWAAERGLKVPLVYNTSGYDSVETLAILNGVVDIYMPDLKSLDANFTQEMMSAPDYPEVVREAIREMHGQVGDLETDEQGIATRGLLVRHLVMPADLSTTRDAMRFLAREISGNTYVNVMAQYRPCGRAFEDPRINRSVTREEYNRALEIAEEEGITRLDQRAKHRLRFF